MNCPFISEHPNISTILAGLCILGAMFLGSIAVSLYLSFRSGK